MNTQQIALLQRIQEFQLDDSASNFSFSQRLARENGWTVQYAKSVIDEYKKFIFLAIVSGHPVTPSDQVDQVWHLHLAYSSGLTNYLTQVVYFMLVSFAITNIKLGIAMPRLKRF
jgi:hypothetical protein